MYPVVAPGRGPGRTAPAPTGPAAPLGTAELTGTAPAVAAPFGSGGAAQAPVSWPVLAVVSAGGVAGALVRYALGVAFPHRPGGFPWTTFGINVSGCLLIGVLMVLVIDAWPNHRLLRPMLGTGLLGGYTTFSSYAVEIQHLVAAGAVGTALAYLAATLLGALAAVYAGTTAARLCRHGIRRHREKR